MDSSKLPAWPSDPYEQLKMALEYGLTPEEMAEIQPGDLLVTARTAREAGWPE